LLTAEGWRLAADRAGVPQGPGAAEAGVSAFSFQLSASSKKESGAEAPRTRILVLAGGWQLATGR